MEAAFSGAILESKGNAYDFSEKLQKRPKNWKKGGQNIWKFGQKCTKFENILEKGRWLRAIIAHKQPENALLFY